MLVELVEPEAPEHSDSQVVPAVVVARASVARTAAMAAQAQRVVPRARAVAAQAACPPASVPLVVHQRSRS